MGKKGGPRVFYGWWIVAVSTVATCLDGALYFYGFSTFFLPLTQEFGWGRAALSGAFSLSRLEGGIMGPLGGFLVDRLGPGKLMLAGVSLMGAGYIVISRIDSLLAFYLVFILLIAAGSTIALHQATLVAVANWFIRKRGLAMGIVMSGIGLGGLGVPLLTWLILGSGWRIAAVVAGLVVWAVGIPLALAMRHRPEDHGLLADGRALAEADQGAPDPNAEATPMVAPDFTPGQALRTPVFWMLCFTLGLRWLVVSAVVVHFIPLMVGIGLSQEVAATMLASLAVVSIIGRLSFGWLGDLFEKRYVMASSLLLLTIGCLLCAAMQDWWYALIFVIVYAPGYGGGATLMFAIRAEYFGRRHFGTIMGLMDFIQIWGVVLGPVFAGWVWDVTGSYSTAFLIFAATSALSMALMLALRRPVLEPAPEVELA